MTRRRVAAVAGEGGFGVVELVVAMTLLSIVMAMATGGMSSALKAYSASKAKTSSETVVNDYLETVRSMSYNAVGVVGGNPAGTLLATRTVTVGGVLFDVVTDVSYVEDRAAAASVTAADYKRVEVTITQRGKTAPDGVYETLLAPPSAASAGNALARVTVVDYGNTTALSGAVVDLRTGPDAPRTDTTSSTGSVVFAGLTPSASLYDDLVASKAGYVTLADDVVPAAASHALLAAGQTWSTSLRLYRPASIVVNLNAAGGGAFAASTSVTVSSSRGSQTFTVTGGTTTITSVAGELVVPGLQYTVTASSTVGAAAYGATAGPTLVPPAYPTSLISTFNLTMAPLQLVVSLKVSGGAAFTNSSTVTVSSSAGSEAFTITGGAGTITSVAGAALVAGRAYTVTGVALVGTVWSGGISGPTAFPTSPQTQAVTVTMATLTTATLTGTTKLSGTACAGSGTTSASVKVLDITGGQYGVVATVSTLANGTYTVNLPKGTTAYTLGYSTFSGTVVVNGAATCNLRTG